MTSSLTFDIADHQIGGGRCFIIAEIAQAHDGSLGAAHAYIDAAADAGADAVKFQTHIAAAESTLDEPFRIKFSKQDDTRYDYWQRMEFTADQWQGLRDHAQERGLVFLSSAFSLEAVDLLEAIGMPAWKVGSGEVYSKALLSRMASTGKPVLLSSGLCDVGHLENLTKAFAEQNVPHGLFQCTSKYPTPLSEIGLNVLDDLKKHFPCPVGLSDHSGRPEPAIAAIAKGADMIEVHLTFDKRCFGPDTIASVTIEELTQITRFRDCLLEMEANPLDKASFAQEQGKMKSTFGKSLALKADLSAGTVLSEEHLTLKKPGDGIPEQEISTVIGRRLLEDVPANRLLRWKHMETNT